MLKCSVCGEVPVDPDNEKCWIPEGYKDVTTGSILRVDYAANGFYVRHAGERQSFLKH